MSPRYAGLARAFQVPTSFRVNEKTGVQMMAKGDPLSCARPVIVRDLALEWEILTRVSPAVAHALEAQTDRYLTTRAK